MTKHLEQNAHALDGVSVVVHHQDAACALIFHRGAYSWPFNCYMEFGKALTEPATEGWSSPEPPLARQPAVPRGSQLIYATQPKQILPKKSGFDRRRPLNQKTQELTTSRRERLQLCPAPLRVEKSLDSPGLEICRRTIGALPA